jgi:hypothetical protein
MTKNEFKKLEVDLLRSGYARYISYIDAQVDEDECCPECGSKIAYHTGFRSVGYISSYRCFAVCDSCNGAFEF